MITAAGFTVAGFTAAGFEAAGFEAACAEATPALAPNRVGISAATAIIRFFMGLLRLLGISHTRSHQSTTVVAVSTSVPSMTIPDSEAPAAPTTGAPPRRPNRPPPAPTS
ncbi:hypothetical protein VSR01_18410 [Actinacidiphila sp. DG2A-62]|uniref:hypothetical protein n=1 Tax=Actinacidiphila sp. DG2A-62 TaxID=3108821 RepID=UPI002DBAAF9A|nr:hypothetical protein [Actinacidiphila sp. DG2A-62]MEC3995399.1 hypothetical protein [Actinacidiphila sp. DG2A-62]